VSETKKPPIVSHKHYDASSAFTPESLLREARRQKVCPRRPFPKYAFLIRTATSCGTSVLRNAPTVMPAGPATTPTVFRCEKRQYGIVGHAVGTAFAVLVAEELFASGCRFLVSMTSAGQILPIQTPPYFIVIDRALRDEGTSYHYLPPSDYSEADARLTQLAREAVAAAGISVRVGATGTTDAPFRETQAAIDAAVQAEILAVEMEAAALYAFAKARGRPVLCFAHVTNQMGRMEGDFEKGAGDGAEESLRVILLTADQWQRRRGGERP
jgi:uridine phosphorylase